MSIGTERIDLSKVEFTPELLQCIPRHLAYKYRVLPVSEAPGWLRVAAAEACNFDVLDSLTYLLHRELEFRLAEPQQLDEFIHRLYGIGDGHR